MVISGKTTDGRYVVKGLFKLFDEKGIPIYVIFEGCINRNLLPDWIGFYHEAVVHGWKHKTVINRLKDNMMDIYEPGFIDVVIDKLENLFNG